MERAEFEAIAEAAGRAVKGKKMPYCAVNGNMFAFLDGDAVLCLRFDEARRAELAAGFGSGEVLQYGSVMRGYVALPDTADAAALFAESYAFAQTLKPKATKR